MSERCQVSGAERVVVDVTSMTVHLPPPSLVLYRAKYHVLEVTLTIPAYPLTSPDIYLSFCLASV